MKTLKDGAAFGRASRLLGLREAETWNENAEARRGLRPALGFWAPRYSEAVT